MIDTTTKTIFQILCYFGFVKFVENLEYFQKTKLLWDSTRAAPLMDCTTAVVRHSYSALKLIELVPGSTWTGASSYLAATISGLRTDRRLA